MRFNIIHDTPGRIRLRCGKNYFGKDREESLADLIMDVPYVFTVKVTSINGGIFVVYQRDYRENLLAYISSLGATDIEKREVVVDEDLRVFKKELTKMVIRRFVLRHFIPVPFRNVISVIRAIPYLKAGLKSLAKFKMNVALLDGAAVGAALSQGMHSEVSSIVFLLRISELLEDFTRKRTKSALAESLAVNVENVWKVTEEGEKLVPLSTVCKGDKVVFRDGSMIAVDGTVVSGEAEVNEASMTGEPLPSKKTAGSVVYAGTVIEEGSITVSVLSAAKDTRISNIIDMIENGEEHKAGVQSRAEKLADRIVPYSLLLSIATYLFTRNITKALSVLMVDYSCAIKLATPISVISAMREASAQGFVVKGGKYLETFAHVDTIVFDKTGTLTNACPVVEKIISFKDYSDDEVLRIAACLEEHFPHSVAKAVVKAAQERGLHHEEEHAEVEYVVAHGIATSLHDKRAIIGSEHFVFEDEGVYISEETKARLEKETEGFSTIYLAIAGELAGAICINDPPRSEAAEAIQMLRDSGINQIVMLTGDHISAAERTAKMLNIHTFKAQVLPEDKANIISQLKGEGKKVVMIGDGINDSPALALSDVSIAMKDSSDLAREVADITLLSGDMRDLAMLRKLSENLFKRINRNYAFIATFNTALILLGICGIITPSVSSLLHNSSTMLISAHSMTPLMRY